MKKEVFLAIIIGFALGLVITYGVWTANKTLKETAPKKEEVLPKEEVQLSPSPSPAAPLSLILNSPEDNFLSNNEKLTVSGKTAPGATVAVVYQEGEKVIEADEEGNFQTEITLVGGANEITVSAYDENGNETSKTLTVVYSTAEI